MIRSIDIEMEVTLPALKDGASSFSGNCETAALANRTPTDIASTSSNGLSARQHPQPFGADIHRRIDVAIMARIALGARPCSNIERHTFANEAASRTGFRAWIPAVALDERLTGTRRLVFEEVCQRGPSSVAGRLRESVVGHYPLHIQVLDADHLVFVDDPSRQFVQEVFADARDALMRAGDQFASLVAALGAFLFARQRLLFPLEVARRHDDEDITGGLAMAAAAYALSGAGWRNENTLQAIWPWARRFWNPKDKRRDLVRAGALIIAEIERLDRLAAREAKAGCGGRI